jgi:signal transduction histidine kinase
MAPAETISHQLYVISLWRLSAALNATFDLERVLQAAEELIVAYTGADVGYLMLLDDEGQAETPGRSPGLGNGSAAAPEARSILQRALSGEAVIATQVAGVQPPSSAGDRTNGRRNGSPAARSACSVLCVPLTVRGKVIGVIYLEGLARFELWHRELVMAFANHAAVAIENARLYARLRDAFEERLRLQQELAEEAQRAAVQEKVTQTRIDFHAVMHNLKNPLWVIENSAQKLVERGELLGAAEREEAYQMIRGQTARLLALVGNLQDLARDEEGKELGLNRQPVDIALLLHRFGKMTPLYPGFSEQQHRVVVTTADELPTAEADYYKILQILDNLISNAVKYSPHGGQITLAAAVREGEIHVSVSDEGDGMTPEQQACLFQPYATVEKDGAPQSGGTGLGLYLSRKHVELHAGRISVESTPGVGSRFTFTLPLVS